MKFEQAYENGKSGQLTQAEAVVPLGQSERSFRRHVERDKADGLGGTSASAATSGEKPHFAFIFPALASAIWPDNCLRQISKRPLAPLP